MVSRAIVWVLRNEKTGLALVTGQGHDELVFEVAPQAKWSRAGRGWVISLQQAADLCTLCETQHAIYRERRPKP
ncbi:hypothetical protein OG558_19715 [Kribbella sp. NBC_01510]|uniref:hypothetical protein n=1 Tax=Kribbella sp. NBC_01510 TaxID=2903581 RepID=UPI0038644DFE